MQRMLRGSSFPYKTSKGVPPSQFIFPIYTNRCCDSISLTFPRPKNTIQNNGTPEKKVPKHQTARGHPGYPEEGRIPPDRGGDLPRGAQGHPQHQPRDGVPQLEFPPGPGAGPGDPLGQRFLLAGRGGVPPSRPFPLHAAPCDPPPSVPPVPRGDPVERGNPYLLGELPGPARHRRLQPLRTGGILTG